MVSYHASVVWWCWFWVYAHVFGLHHVCWGCWQLQLAGSRLAIFDFLFALHALAAENHWRRRACWLRSYKRHTRFFYVLFLFASLLIRNSLNWNTLRAVVTNVFPYLPRHVTQLASIIVSLVLASAFWLSAAWPDSSSCTCRHISSINCKKHLRTCGMNSFLKRTHSSDSSALMLILQLAKNNNK